MWAQQPIISSGAYVDQASIHAFTRQDIHLLADSFLGSLDFRKAVLGFCQSVLLREVLLMVKHLKLLIQLHFLLLRLHNKYENPFREKRVQSAVVLKSPQGERQGELIDGRLFEKLLYAHKNLLPATS